MSRRSKVIYVRLNDDEKELVRKLANHYDITESAVVRIAIKQLAKTREVLP